MASSSALEALLAASPSLERALPGLDRSAAGDVPILILGEPGTGRSSLARAIHAASPRGAGPLVELDVAAVPTSLFESELFGHRAGAFTGASEAAEGKVRRAEGGTLVLDHVEDLPISTQPKLLRLISERSYAPLGGVERTGDVRFVALGSADLPERVAAGSFRTDLFYRLEVVTYRLPPLRDRRGDLPSLVRFFLADLAERQGIRRPRLAESTWQWLVEYRWPGNLRQLRNLLERQMLLHPGARSLEPSPPRDVEQRPRSLAEAEEELIRQALAYTRGRQQAAADLLGISRKTLWEKRKRYGLP